MSLNYDYTKCENQDQWNDADHYQAKNFCWGMIAIDIGEITAETEDEIYFRYRFMEKIGYNVFSKPLDLRKLGEMLRKLRGYKTNIGYLPRFKFIRRHIKSLERDIMNDNGSKGDVIQ